MIPSFTAGLSCMIHFLRVVGPEDYDAEGARIRVLGAPGEQDDASLVNALQMRDVGCKDLFLLGCRTGGDHLGPHGLDAVEEL